MDHHLRVQPPPEVLLIQLGSNDLATIKGKELIELIRLEILRLRTLFPHTKLIWSEILPRRYWHFADNQVAVEICRKRVNNAVKRIFLSDIENGCVIRHPNIMYIEKSLFRMDGVHLSEVGIDVYLNNIKGALEAFLNQDCKVFE